MLMYAYLDNLIEEPEWFGKCVWYLSGVWPRIVRRQARLQVQGGESVMHRCTSKANICRPDFNATPA